MSFTDGLWDKIAPIYQNILQLPFNVELASGTLAEEKFLFYMEQDAAYLVGFARALALIAGRSTSSNNVLHFLKFGFEAIVTERELHTHYITPRHNWGEKNPSPACLGYTQYLIAKASTGSIEEAMAAILPCFWVYREVGRSIAANVKRDNPYISWIDTYSSPEFSEGVEQAIVLLNEVASKASEAELRRMEKAFEYSAQFEWYFWDDAYHMRVFGQTINTEELRENNVLCNTHQ